MLARTVSTSNVVVVFSILRETSAISISGVMGYTVQFFSKIAFLPSFFFAEALDDGRLLMANDRPAAMPRFAWASIKKKKKANGGRITSLFLFLVPVLSHMLRDTVLYSTLFNLRECKRVEIRKEILQYYCLL